MFYANYNTNNNMYNKDLLGTTECNLKDSKLSTVNHTVVAYQCQPLTPLKWRFTGIFQQVSSGWL